MSTSGVPAASRSQNETSTTETDGIEAPAYSFHSSTTSPYFQLEAIGEIVVSKKVKYSCGEVLDDRYFLLGTNHGLEFIDLSLSLERQSPKKLIDLVRFKQLKIIQSKNYETLLALAGKNKHVRSYDLNSIRLLIKSKEKYQQQQTLSSSPSGSSTKKSQGNQHGRTKSMDLVFETKPPNNKNNSSDNIKNNRCSVNNNTWDSLFTGLESLSLREHNDNSSSSGDNINNFNNHNDGDSNRNKVNTDLSTGPIHQIEQTGYNVNYVNSSVPLSSSNNVIDSSSVTNSNDQQQPPQNVSKSNRNSLFSKEYDFQRNLQFQLELDYFKLPNTKMSLSFVARTSSTNAYVAVLTKVNILLFQIFSTVNDDDNDSYSEFVQIGNYWLPQTPKFLQISITGGELNYVIAVFHSEIFKIRIEDAHVIEIPIDTQLRSTSSSTSVNNDNNNNNNNNNINDLSLSNNQESQSWQSFSPLSWIPNINPELLSEDFTIPPPYNSIINEHPSTMLKPVPIIAFANNFYSSVNNNNDNNNNLSLSSTVNPSDHFGLPSLFFATFYKKSMIINHRGKSYSTVVFNWTHPPLHIEFLRSAKPDEESYVVGFSKNTVEVLNLSSGRVVENVIKGIDVKYLARGTSNSELILGCSSDNKGTKYVCFYKLKVPTN